MTQFLEQVPHPLRLAIAAPLTVLAAAIALASHGRWQANQRALRQGAPLPPSALPRTLAFGIAAVAVSSAVVLLVQLLK